MMKRKLKSAAAVALVVSMVAGSSFAAFATDTTEVTEPPAEGGLSGTGKIEAIVDEEIFRVVLPTIVAPDPENGNPGTTTFNFFLDPEQVIKATKGAAFQTEFGFTDAEFESKVPGWETDTLYFVNREVTTASNAFKSLTNRSDLLKVINKSSIKVDISLVATLTPPDNVTLAATPDFKDSENAAITGPSMFLGIVNGPSVSMSNATAIGSEGETEEPETEEIPSAAAEVSGVTKGTDDLYSVKYDATTKTYEYKLDTAVANDLYTSIYQFGLIGATNKDVSWKSLMGGDMDGEIDVTWKITGQYEDEDKAPSIVGATSATVTAKEEIPVQLSFGRGALAADSTNPIHSVSCSIGGDGEWLVTRENYTLDLNTKQLTFTDTVAGWVLDDTASFRFTIYFNNPGNTPVVFTMTKQ